MLPKFMNPFKVGGQVGKKQLNQKRKFNASSDEEGGHVSSSQKTNLDVGLRVLVTKINNSNSKSNVLVKSALRKRNQTSSPINLCYLKTCNLCNKKLRPDEDVYMYRGDQGFCSMECRDRQIVLDEMRESESSRKQMVASHRHCWNDARHETRHILEDLLLLRLKSEPVPCTQNHWAIVS